MNVFMYIHMYICMYLIVLPYLLKQKTFGSLLYPQGLEQYLARHADISLNE